DRPAPRQGVATGAAAVRAGDASPVSTTFPARRATSHSSVPRWQKRRAVAGRSFSPAQSLRAGIPGGLPWEAGRSAGWSSSQRRVRSAAAPQSLSLDPPRLVQKTRQNSQTPAPALPRKAIAIFWLGPEASVAVALAPATPAVPGAR